MLLAIAAVGCVTTAGPRVRESTDATARAVTRESAATAAREEITRSLTGEDRDDMLSLLSAAAAEPDEAHRYQAYVGAWQYMQLISMQGGQTAQQKASLDAVQTIARTFPDYHAEDFME